MGDLGDLLIEGLTQAIDHAKGKKTGARERVVLVHVPEKIDVLAIRKKLGLNRTAFAARFGFHVQTLTKWERGERQPEGPARAYLKVIAHNPAAVETALQAP
jgi:putative transcriptional regulator